MKNLTLFNAVFALMLVGKIGNIGDLGELNLLWVIAPLIINYLIDLFYHIAEVQGFKGFIASYMNLRKLKNIQKNYPDIFEKARWEYAEQLKKEKYENNK